jgi:hypothetical protein
MARARAFVLFVAVLLVLSGCKAFFDFNAFSSLDKASVPNPSRYQGSGGLANLQADLQSHAIVAALSGDPTTVATILGNLNTAYAVTTGPLTTPDAQAAAILYSDLALQTTSGDVLVNNMVATMMTTPPGNLQSILQSIVPPDVAADINKFTAMVNGLLQANVAYDVLGQSLAGLPAPPGMNMGDTAQKAAVAWLMYKVDLAVIGAVGAPAAVAQMFALVNNQTNSIAGVTTVPANPLNPIAAAGLTPPSLKRIFDAAGAPYPA